MASFNKVLLMGNLTRDPQLKYLPSETAVAEFGVAINRKFKGGNGEEREEVTFVDVTAFGKTGEVINQYFTKGKPIFIEGRLKYDQWEDKNGGGKRSKLSVVVDNFQFIGGRDGGDDGNDRGGSPAGNSNRRPAESRKPAPRSSPPQEQPYTDEQHFGEDDIPF